MLSTIDGLNLFTGKMDEATHFGGRGFSIWKTSDMSLVFDSGDEIEKELANSMKTVFNTDCIRNTITYQGPENLRDTQSDDYVSTALKHMVDNKGWMSVIYIFCVKLHVYIKII